MTRHRALHPLLLEPRYWRNRLKARGIAARNLETLPRPDLSRTGIEVRELRFQAHDGLALWGLVVRGLSAGSPCPARIRLVGVGETAAVDEECIRSGCADILLQEPPARRLEDRVLDVLTVWEIAGTLEGIDQGRIRLEMPSREEAPDEFLIAEELRALGLARTAQA